MVTTLDATASGNLAHHLRRTIQLAWPVMLARAGLLVMALVDAVMIGHVSGPDLAYYGIAMSPFLLFMLVGTGLLIGTVVLVAQADGAGERQRAGAVWRLALTLALVAGLCLTLVLLPGPALLKLLGQPPDLVRHGGTVLQILALGLVPMLLFTASSLFLEGLARPGVGLAVMVAANLVNAALNALFLYGPLDLFDGAAANAAFATTLTRWLMAAVIVGYVLAALDRQALGIGRLPVDARRLFTKLIWLGLPIAGATGLESLAFTTMSLFAGWLGTLEAAAYLICLNFSALIYMLALGLGTAASVRVGNAVGRGDQPGVAAAGWVALALGLAITLLLAPAVMISRSALAEIYTGDAQVIEHALPALTVVAVLIVVDAVQGILMGALRGAGDVRIPLAIQAVAYLGVAIPLGYTLGFTLDAGIEGLIQGLVAGLATAALLLGWRFWLVSRRRTSRA